MHSDLQIVRNCFAKVHKSLHISCTDPSSLNHPEVSFFPSLDIQPVKALIKITFVPDYVLGMVWCTLDFHSGAGLLPWKAKQRRHCNVHSMWSSQTTRQRLEDFHSIASRCLASHSHICAEDHHGGYTFNFISFGSFQTNALGGFVSLTSPGRRYLTKVSRLQELPLGIHWTTCPRLLMWLHEGTKATNPVGVKEGELGLDRPSV